MKIRRWLFPLAGILVLSIPFLHGDGKVTQVLRFEGMDGFAIYSEETLALVSRDPRFCERWSAAEVDLTSQEKWIAAGRLNYWTTGLMFARIYSSEDPGRVADADLASICKSVEGVYPLAEGFVREKWSDLNTCQWSQDRKVWQWKVEGILRDRSGQCRTGACRYTFQGTYQLRQDAYILDGYCDLDADDLELVVDSGPTLDCGPEHGPLRPERSPER